MPSPTPSGSTWQKLDRRFGVEHEPGHCVYPQGAVTQHLYLVRSGRIVFEVVDLNGARAVVHEAGPGDWLGHVSTVSGRPTSACAVVAAPSLLLEVPMEQAVEFFREAPELALALIRQFAGDGRPRRAATAATLASAPAPAGPPVERAKTPLPAAYDEQSFFIDDVACPVCHTTFDYLRVRTGAVKSAKRDSDFRVTYRGVDPTHYSVVVCPHCGYAAYGDDFDQLSAAERTALAGLRDVVRPQPDARSPLPNLCGERTLDGAAQALDQALACYSARDAEDRRRAGLLHRRAWLERERGNAEREQQLLREARDAYRLAYERDTSIEDGEAVRAAYLIGDLSLRVGEAEDAARWFLSCVRMPEGKQQASILRMARERLSEAREEMGRSRIAS